MGRNIETPGIILPGVEDITRRDFLIGGAAAILLGGCGSNGNEDESSGKTKTVEHAMGTTEVPVNPERIITLNDTLMTHLLAVDFEPVGSCGIEGDRFRTEKFDTTDIEHVGILNEPNLEAVAGLRPDLILGFALSADVYPELSRIAPTVLLEPPSPGDTLFEFDRKVLDTAGVLEEYEEQVARYENRRDELKPRFEPLAGMLSVNVISGGYTEGTFAVQGSDQFSWLTWAVALEELGLRPPKAPDTFAEISTERLPEWDADVLFVQMGPGERREVLSSPLMQSLNAYRKGQVYEVPIETWTAPRVGALIAVLDDLKKYLLDREIDTSGDFR
jgi:iron complex transport system substrate-binding protein